jgi:arylsulfatase
MVISWPAGMSARGEVRHQYHHAVVVVPTILEACGVEFPDVYEGVDQQPLPGVSMRYSFDAADAPTTKQVQYYEMTGTRGLWHEGWKVVATHGSQPGIGNFDQDPWELYHVDDDRAEARDLAAEHPDRVDQLVKLWFEEAAKYNVLPLNDLLVHEMVTGGLLYHEPVAPSGQFVYYPGTSSIPEQTAANTHGVSWRALADVTFEPGTEGVVFAHGSRFAGHALFVKDGQLYYVYNFLGIPPEQRLVGPAPVSGRHVVGIDFAKESIGDNHEAHGTATLYIGDTPVATDQIRTCNRFSLCGEGLCIGYDDGDAVSSLYQPRFSFTGGTLHKVVFDVADDLYIDLEQHLAAAYARD